jgi:hypothetical protein
MADSLFDILARKDFSEPSEMVAIKGYIQDHFQTEAEVIAHEFEIIIVVPSASLAGVLRFHVRKIQTAAQTKKRLVIRIR